MKRMIRTPELAHSIRWLLVTFLVLFPKGGIKVGETPLTWGYLLLALLFLPLFLVRVLSLPLRQPVLSAVTFVSLVPFHLLFLYSYEANGVENVGYALAVATAFFFLPILFLLLFPWFLQAARGANFRRHLCFCVLAAAVWGIFLFFYHPIMGKYIEIPYLTVNAGDYGLLESTKHINRGGYLKLISTYNNGNLYGVAMLILLPLYLLFEPALWKRNVVRVALVMTLSRTVWAGLVLEQGMSFVWSLLSMLKRFPRIQPGPAVRAGIPVLLTVALVFGGLIFNSAGLGFLLNNGLAGREGEFASFLNPTWLPARPLSGFDEALYASALRSYGILGFLAIALIFVLPFLLLAWKPEILRSPVRRAAAKGLILYAIVAGIDGATILIPVMAFYWFAYMVMLFGLPADTSGLTSAPRTPELATA